MTFPGATLGTFTAGTGESVNVKLGGSTANAYALLDMDVPRGRVDATPPATCPSRAVDLWRDRPADAGVIIGVGVDVTGPILALGGKLLPSRLELHWTAAKKVSLPLRPGFYFLACLLQCCLELEGVRCRGFRLGGIPKLPRGCLVYGLLERGFPVLDPLPLADRHGTLGVPLPVLSVHRSPMSRC